MITFHNTPDSISERMKDLGCEIKEISSLELVGYNSTDVRSKECYRYQSEVSSDSSMITEILNAINSGDTVTDITKLVPKENIKFVNIITTGNNKERLAIATGSGPSPDSYSIELVRLSPCKRYLENMELRYRGNKKELCLFLVTYIQLLVAYMIYCSSISSGVRAKRELKRGDTS